MTKMTTDLIKGFHIGNGWIADSDGFEGHDIYFLLDRAGDINCFYHLNYNVACLLKMMGITESQGKQLVNTGRINLGGMHLKYKPGKFFGVGTSNKFISFADMHQYHAEELWRQDPEHDHKILAKRAREVGNDVYEALVSIGLHPKTITSPVRPYQNEVLMQANIPTVDDLPELAGKMAYECVRGNWLEAYRIGHYEHIYDYDRISAYPSEAAKLLDIRRGRWLRSSEYQAGATYGFCRGMVETSSDILPILYSVGRDRRNRLNYTPTGARNDTLTKSQIDYLRETGKGYFDITDAMWWFCDYPVKIYEPYILELHEHKERLTGFRRTIIKRIPNGAFYGKTIEKLEEDRPGDLFNPVAGALIETNNEIAVARFCDDNKLDPIQIAVDGVLTDKKVPDNVLSDEMGGWKLTNEGACFVMGAGAVALKGKTGKGDFSLDYDWIADQIEKEPEASEYRLTKPAPVTLPIATRGNWDKLGTLHEISRSIDLTFESKRLFPEMPNCGKKLYNGDYRSEPLDVSMLWCEPESEPEIFDELVAGGVSYE